jgi:hypothetical protein
MTTDNKIIDATFVKFNYYPILKLKNSHTLADNELVKYVQKNKCDFKWTNYNDFIEQTKFDYKFYSVYYEIEFNESHAIYHYINHGIFINNYTNLNTYIEKYVELPDQKIYI